MAADAIERNGLFQAIDEQSMIKIDFHVGEKIPGELGRSTLREIAPGLIAPLVSKEDAILSKLLWIQMGSGIREDTTSRNAETRRDLDREPGTAATLGLQDLLEEIEGEVRGWSPS